VPLRSIFETFSVKAIPYLVEPSTVVRTGHFVAGLYEWVAAQFDIDVFSV
jgi:hypothetical protein